MYELARVRLHSIGPRGARFGDVLLDFSGVGGPVTGPRQEPLFDTVPAQQPAGPPAVVAGAQAALPDTETVPARDPRPGPEPAAARRPSPASVLFLENGGGKSVLMKLIFSVVLPGRRHVVGTSNGRVLDNFVLPRDCGQVICEWQHAVTGDRVVTGKVSEWRGRGPADGGRLAEAWYSLRPRAGLELTSLPLRRDGRLVTLGGFREELTRAHAADPSLELTWETHQGAWLEHLDGLGLDPELFRYQRAMNAGEGEAAEAFAFSTDEGFVEFLLRAVTPPEDPAGVAEVVDGYAAKLAERTALAAERDFVAGALERLAVLVEALRERDAAQTGLASARAELSGLAAAVEGRLRAGETDRVGLDTQLAAARDAEATAETGRARAGDRVAALRRRLAELRLAAAEAARDELVTAARAAATAVEGWRATAETLRLAAASAEATRLTDLVAQAQDAAAPALAERDAAARALVAGLLAVADESRAAADAADARADEHERAAESAAEAERRALDQAATTRADERVARGPAVSAAAALTAAGLLPGVGPSPTSGPAGRASLLTAAAGLADAATDAASEADAAAAAVRDALAEVGRLDRARTAATEANQQAERAADAARAGAVALADQLAAADDAAADILADGRVAALLGLAGSPAPAAGGTAAELDRIVEEALAALRNAVAAGEERRLALSVEAGADQRVLAALGDDELRPARPEALAVCAALAEAGLVAQPGWSYLARAVAAAADREAVLRRRPDLADGVVLTGADPDGDLLGRASEILFAARLVPAAAVRVATAAVLTAVAAEPNGAAAGEHSFVVPPNPALYDTDAAASERAALLARAGERAALLARLGATIEADRALVVTLAGWRRAHPAGQVERLTAQLAAARAAALDADGAAARTAAEAAAARAAADQALVAVEDRRAVELRAAARAAELDRLLHAVGTPAGDLARADELAAEAGRVDVAAAEHRAAAAAARRAAADARRAADGSRRNAETARAEAADVVGAGPGDPAVPDSPAARVPVAVLRAGYDATSRAYQQVAVGADLTAALELARRDEAAARAALDVLPAEVRQLAGRLLEGPDGADAAARAAAGAAAQRRAAALAAELDETRERIGGLREEARAAGEEARRRGAPPLTGAQVPTDARHAERLLADAYGGVRAAEAELGRARTARERLGVLAGRHDGALAEFRAVAELMTDALADTGRRDGTAETRPADAGPSSDGDGAATDSDAADFGADGGLARVAPFDGGPDDARAAARAARDAWRAASATLVTASGAVRAAADAVAAWAGQDRFDGVRAPARRQMVQAGREAVAASAAAWADALAPRLRSLDDDLAHIGRNRAAIVARLEGMVRTALGTLRAAQRLSRLPDRLGDWSGQEFLRISLRDPDPAALADALGGVVDAAATTTVARAGSAADPDRTGPTAGSAATGPGGRPPAVRTDGMTLLLRGVRAALPRGVRVEVLKPDAVLRTERVRVSELGDVFSGGQQLTAAIILYCTMAALRANDRGQLRTPHAGVLFLDNPIGRASAGYLLDLQLAVADRLGVQLVYTTGLFDTAALAAFPLVIRLRNDADLRAGLKYLRVAEELRQGLPAVPESGDGSGALTATRVHRRPA